MVKANTLVYFVLHLHTYPHAEPDKTTFHIILHIIVHLKMLAGSLGCEKSRKKLFLQILS